MSINPFNALSVKIPFVVKVRTISLAILFIGTSSSIVYAQTSKIPAADWTHSISTSDYKVGDVIEIVLKTDLPEDYHIYSNDFSDDCPPLKAELTFMDNDGSYEVIGGLVPFGAEKEMDDIFRCEISWFHKHAEFRQKVKILKENPTLNASLFYQVCSEDMCVNFDYKFEVNFKKTF